VQLFTETRQRAHRLAHAVPTAGTSSRSSKANCGARAGRARRCRS
jgi:hypothetical protein